MKQNVVVVLPDEMPRTVGQLCWNETVYSRWYTCQTTSPKSPFRASWKVSDPLVDKENAGWTALNGGHFCPCQNCPKWPVEKTGRGSLLNRPSCPPDDPIGQGAELMVSYTGMMCWVCCMITTAIFAEFCTWLLRLLQECCAEFSAIFITGMSNAAHDYAGCTEFSVWLYQLLCRVQCVVIPVVLQSSVYVYTRCFAELSVLLYQALCRV